MCPMRARRSSWVCAGRAPSPPLQPGVLPRRGTGSLFSLIPWLCAPPLLMPRTQLRLRRSPLVHGGPSPSGSFVHLTSAAGLCLQPPRAPGSSPAPCVSQVSSSEVAWPPRAHTTHDHARTRAHTRANTSGHPSPRPSGVQNPGRWLRVTEQCRFLGGDSWKQRHIVTFPTAWTGWDLLPRPCALSAQCSCDFLGTVPAWASLSSHG